MDTQDIKLSTGMPGLDQVLKGLIPGDNVVWQIGSIEDYSVFVRPYASAAMRAGKKLIYFRFASHAPLLSAEQCTEMHTLKPEEGFEAFIAAIHTVIERSGRGAFYVFDCLSELAGDWYSDRMLGNFFMLTCPYLFDLETITYFALNRDRHSQHAIMPITETTQLFLDVIRHNARRYVRPIKVQHRYSPTMHLLHEMRGDNFVPITSSTVIADILEDADLTDVDESMDFAARTALEAEDVLREVRAGRGRIDRVNAVFGQLCRMIISRDEKILSLVSKYMTLEDVLAAAKRLIGSGLIGGKSVGMLLARSILKKTDARFMDILETHDSFYIGSDVFYTYLVRNGVWWMRQKQRDPEHFLEGSEEARRRILSGRFTDYIVGQFRKMIDHFGQSPFIVRSSSLLEDNFGNSFAGKYESVFCANQGPLERRLEDFLAAVRSIYASSMGERALRYRASRGLLDHDEQMALLVMRVSGDAHSRHYYPSMAGVGFSYNPFVWNRNIDPKAGVLRIVFGLGTRAVNRSDDDYTRLVALNDPSRRPESSFDAVRQYSQRKVDYLDLEANQLVSGYFSDIAANVPEHMLDLFTTTGTSERNTSRTDRALTFDTLLGSTAFAKDMRDMLAILQSAYDYPVDIEYTANFDDEKNYRINLVQCRPLQVKGADVAKVPAIEVAHNDIIMQARSAVVGRSRMSKIGRIIYIVPEKYSALTVSERYEVAHAIGDINKLTPDGMNVMLIGPGRWGTSSPELGIPVTFSEINRTSILCELVMMREDLVPDVSLGTHFLNELVEWDMLYLALFPRQADSYLNYPFFEGSSSLTETLVPSRAKWKDVIRVIDTGEKGIGVAADAQEQKVICYRLK